MPLAVVGGVGRAGRRSPWVPMAASNGHSRRSCDDDRETGCEDCPALRRASAAKVECAVTRLGHDLVPSKSGFVDSIPMVGVGGSGFGGQIVVNDRRYAPQPAVMDRSNPAAAHGRLALFEALCACDGNHLAL